MRRVLGYLQPIDFFGSFPLIIVYKHEPCGAGSTADGGMAVAVIPAILTVAFLTLVVQKTYPMDTRGFTSVFQGSIRLNTYLGLAIAGGVMVAKDWNTQLIPQRL